MNATTTAAPAAAPTYGSYVRSFVTDVPADLDSEEAQYYHRTIKRFPEEAVYIYSFQQHRMVYAAGWEEVFGYGDDEINMHILIDLMAPKFAPFSYDLFDKAMMFIQTKTTDLDKYSFTMELKKMHRDGTEIPMVVKIGVFSYAEGQMTSIIGRLQVNRSLNFGQVMRYAAYGPEKEEFEEILNKALFRHLAISGKEKEALAMVAKGYSFKEIAYYLGVSHSAVEKRILPLYKRFNVKSLPHLVSFAYDNYILP
jgi:DNA-binding CsgD family transcriptional regulator